MLPVMMSGLGLLHLEQFRLLLSSEYGSPTTNLPERLPDKNNFIICLTEAANAATALYQHFTRCRSSNPEEALSERIL